MPKTIQFNVLLKHALKANVTVRQNKRGNIFIFSKNGLTSTVHCHKLTETVEPKSLKRTIQLIES